MMSSKSAWRFFGIGRDLDGSGWKSSVVLVWRTSNAEPGAEAGGPLMGITSAFILVVEVKGAVANPAMRISGSARGSLERKSDRAIVKVEVWNRTYRALI